MRRRFSEQFAECNALKVCEHMSRENHDSMPKSQKKHYLKDKRVMKLPRDYYGPRGPLFCGLSPGICSSDHCPIL